MNSFLRPALILAVYSLVVSCQSRNADPFGNLSKIEGEWAMAAGNKPEDGFIVESWVKVNDTLYSGKSYEVVNGDSILTETIQLISNGADIFYIPTVQAQNNQQPISFRLTKTEGEKFIFENAQHDFPTTIIYEFKNDSTLNASIAGAINGEVRAMDFEYWKVRSKNR